MIESLWISDTRLAICGLMADERDMMAAEIETGDLVGISIIWTKKVLSYNKFF